MPRSLASRCRRCAPSRTWATDPGPPGASGSCTAWMESMAITAGRAASACAHASGSDVSETTRRSSASVPSRSARSRTWAADSSAHTRRQRAPSAAMAPSACRTSVLLPMPGSPPMSVTEPATSPPPSTRSSSATPVARRGAPLGSTSASETGLVLGSESLDPLVAAVVGAASSEPHSPHSGQRPSHFGDSWAQPVHRYRTSVRVIAGL